MEQLESRLLPAPILPDTALAAPINHYDPVEVAELQVILVNSIAPVANPGEDLDIAMFRFYGYTLLHDVRINPTNSDHIQLTSEIPGITWWETVDGGLTWAVLERDVIQQPDLQPIVPEYDDPLLLLPTQQSDQFQPLETNGSDWLVLKDDDWINWQEDHEFN